jgi:hypothetical protein
MDHQTVEDFKPPSRTAIDSPESTSLFDPEPEGEQRELSVNLVEFLGIAGAILLNLRDQAVAVLDEVMAILQPGEAELIELLDASPSFAREISLGDCADINLSTILAVLEKFRDYI